MTIEASIYSFLTSDPGVSAIVGDRVFPGPLPQDIDTPAITYSMEGSEVQFNYDEGESDLIRLSIQFDAWGFGHAVVVSLGSALYSALKNYVGDMAGTTIRAIRKTEGPVDQTEFDIQAFRRSYFFDIWYIEV